MSLQNHKGMPHIDLPSRYPHRRTHTRMVLAANGLSNYEMVATIINSWQLPAKMLTTMHAPCTTHTHVLIALLRPIRFDRKYKVI